MPRFDNEGFNPSKRIDNDSRDRSVPVDENYYAGGKDILDIFSDDSGDVVDRQNSVDIYEYIDSFGAPKRSARQMEDDFIPEVMIDPDEERRERAQKRAENRKSAPTPKPKKKKSKKNTAKKIILGIIAVILAIIILIVAMINGVLGKINYDEKRDNEYIASSELENSAMIKNILLLGVDAREGEEGEQSRADSMMLISVDMKHKCIKTVSFLRDTWVYIPAHEGEQRLNAACAYDGYNGVVDTIEYNFGIDIDGYVVADFNMFEVLVDSIGGVEVKVTKQEAREVTRHKRRYGNVKLKSGTHKLTGKQALAYCRIRKIDSDFMRAKRQRTVIKSILKSVKSSSPFTVYKMAKESAPYIETNLTKSELKRLALCGVMCMAGETVETRVPFDGTWDYANIYGNSVIQINADKNKEMLIDYIYNQTADEILEAEAKADAQQN